MTKNTSFNQIAQSYHTQMGDNGDFTHQHSIDPKLFEMIGKVDDKLIYDIGCGNGYLDRKIAKMGAHKVFASDISPDLISLAKGNNSDKINYFVASGDDFSYFGESFNGTFDLVISNMAIHYISDFEKLIKGVKRLLKGGGIFVFTASHPIDDLSLASDKNILSREGIKSIMEVYLQNYEHNVTWGDMPLTIQKRPLSFYVNEINKQGFLLEKLYEMPKLKLKSDGAVLNTQIPAYFGMSFIKN